MTLRAIATIGAVAAIMAITPVDYAQAHQRPLLRCAPREAPVLRSDRYAQVYKYNFGIYTCIRRHGATPGYLGHTEYTPGVGCLEGEERCGVVNYEMLALAGDVVAYIELHYEAGGGRPPEWIVVRNIATGKVLHHTPVSVATVQMTFIEQSEVLSIVVNDEGAVAWLQRDSYGRHDGGASPHPGYDIFAIDNDGFHSLRVDLPAAPSSLALTGDKLTWTEQGIRHTARLN